MSKENKKHIPRKVVFILAFLSIFIICIPIYYGTTYFANKVTPFASEIETLEASGNKVEKMNYSKFDALDLEFESTKFDVSKDYKASFKIYVKGEHVEGNIKDGKITYQVALAANWINFYSKSSENTITYKSNSTASSVTTVYDLKPLVTRTNYLIPFPKPTTYILISFDSVDNGKISHHSYLLKLKYGSYKIIEGGLTE